MFRNRQVLRQLHRELTRVISRLSRSYELIFVNDACPDGSQEVLRALAADDLRVVVLALAENLGQNRAVLAGLAHARGRTAVVMDADLQDPPAAIPRLLDCLEGGVEAVFAARQGRYSWGLRSLTSRLFKSGLYLLSRGRLPRGAGLFVAMSREMIARLVDFRHPDPYVLSLMARTGLPMAAVPVERSPSPLGGSTYTPGMRLRLAGRAYRILLGPLPRPVNGAIEPPVAELLESRLDPAQGGPDSEVAL